MKRSSNHYAFGRQFGSLLGRGSLPNAEHAGGTAANTGGEWDRGIDKDRPCSKCGLQLLEQRGLAFEVNGQHAQIGGGTGRGVLHTRYVARWADLGSNACGCILCALRVAGAYDHRLTGSRPAKSQPMALGAGTTENRDGAAHRNSATSPCSQLNSWAGSLMLMRE